MTTPEESEAVPTATELARHIADSLGRLAGLLRDPRAGDSIATFAAGLDKLAEHAGELAGVLAQEEQATFPQAENATPLPWPQFERQAEQVAAAEVRAGALAVPELLEALTLLGIEARAKVEDDAAAGATDAAARGEAAARAYGRLLAALTMQARMLEQMNAADALLAEPPTRNEATHLDFPAAAQAMVGLGGFLATFRQSYPAAAFWRVMAAMNDVEKGRLPALMSVPGPGGRKRQQSHGETLQFLATAALQLRRMAHEVGAAGTLGDHFRKVKEALPGFVTLEALKKWDDAAKAGLRLDKAPPASVAVRMKQRQHDDLARLARLLGGMKYQSPATLLRAAEEIEDRLRREWGDGAKSTAKSDEFGLSQRDRQRRS